MWRQPGCRSTSGCRAAPRPACPGPRSTPMLRPKPLQCMPGGSYECKQRGRVHRAGVSKCSPSDGPSTTPGTPGAITLCASKPLWRLLSQRTCGSGIRQLGLRGCQVAVSWFTISDYAKHASALAWIGHDAAGAWLEADVQIFARGCAATSQTWPILCLLEVGHHHQCQVTILTTLMCYRVLTEAEEATASKSKKGRAPAAGSVKVCATFSQLLHSQQSD